MFDELIREVKAIRSEQALAVAEINIQIQALEMRRQGIDEPFDKRIHDLVESWRQRILAYGKTFKCQDGQIAFRKGLERRVWDLDALDAVVAADPEVAAKIGRYRSVSVGEPSFSIK